MARRIFARTAIVVQLLLPMFSPPHVQSCHALHHTQPVLTMLLKIPLLLKSDSFSITVKRAIINCERNFIEIYRTHRCCYYWAVMRFLCVARAFILVCESIADTSIKKSVELERERELPSSVSANILCSLFYCLQTNVWHIRHMEHKHNDGKPFDWLDNEILATKNNCTVA